MAKYRIHLAGVTNPLIVESDSAPTFTGPAEWVTVGRATIRAASVQAVEALRPPKQNPTPGYTGGSYFSG